MKIALFVISIVLVFSSCKKNEDEDPVAPVIEFVSISSTEVEEFENSITIKFNFEDLQGDIGHVDNDIFSLRVKDSRLEEFDWYHIPPMTPDLQALHIRGSYEVQLNTLFLLGNGSNESTTFTLQLQDRNGNWSNQIISPSVLITDTP